MTVLTLTVVCLRCLRKLDLWDCILAACNLNSTKMVTLHAIPFLVVIYSMEFFWVEPDTTHVCLLREGGREGKIQHVKKDVCLLRLKIMVAVLATCSKRRWNSTPLLHSSVCFIILMGMVQEGCNVLIFPQHRFIFDKDLYSCA